MPNHPHAASGDGRHLLSVEADADPNLLLRLLEPFVIHDVLPHRISCAADGQGLAVEIDFSAPGDLATRLHMRLGAMVAVRRADLAPIAVPARASEAA